MQRLALFLALLALATATVARASIAEALTLEELVRESERVVHARTLASAGHYEGNVIVTTTTLEVLEDAKGRGSRTFEVVHLGGVVGDVAMRVEGAPSFAVGTESLVFAGVVNGRMTPVGMSQGVLPVRVEQGSRRVFPGGRGLALVRRSQTGRLGAAPGALDAPRALDAVLEDIRRIAGARP